jgi:hypothetical protein
MRFNTMNKLGYAVILSLLSGAALSAEFAHPALNGGTEIRVISQGPFSFCRYVEMFNGTGQASTATSEPNPYNDVWTCDRYPGGTTRDPAVVRVPLYHSGYSDSPVKIKGDGVRWAFYKDNGTFVSLTVEE